MSGKQKKGDFARESRENSVFAPSQQKKKLFHLKFQAGN
jgi:hypothetical protein